MGQLLYHHGQRARYFFFEKHACYYVRVVHNLPSVVLRGGQWLHRLRNALQMR
jgi:hypothetical protein